MTRSTASKPLPPGFDLGKRLLRWHRRHGRHDLPWQQAPAPYRVWVSEIMLQQTQVATVIPYFERFMRWFPSVTDLARADLDQVLRIWSGLGYYARARNLHAAARSVVERHGGALPADLETLMQLPGIGRSTAGAILALSANLPHPILDGNVKRVLCRYHGLRGRPGRREMETKLWRLAAMHVPERAAAAYTQAIMDLGATLCTRSRPRCDDCPLRADCVANRAGLQGELPERRPKHKIPIRRAMLAIIENTAGQVLLERRPAAGIWGGLWSFPECPPQTDVIDWIRWRFGWPVKQVRQEPALRHTFTHFHLDIEPIRVRLREDKPAVNDSADLVWLEPKAGLTRGVAAPIRRLISDFYGIREGNEA